MDTLANVLREHGYVSDELIGAGMVFEYELGDWITELGLPMEHGPALLDIWKSCRGAPASRAAHRARVDGLFPALAETDTISSAQEADDSLASIPPFKRLRIPSVSQKPDPASSKAAADKELLRFFWQTRGISVIRRMGSRSTILPRLERLQDAHAIADAVFGLRSARSLAKWVRAWELLELHVDASLLPIDSVDTAAVISYLRERAEEPCGFSVPKSIVTGLQFVCSRSKADFDIAWDEVSKHCLEVDGRIARPSAYGAQGSSLHS